MLKKVTTEKVDKHQIHLSNTNEWKINRKQSKDIRVNYYLANLLLQTRGQLEGKSTATITRPSSVPLPCELRQKEKQFSMICACTWLYYLNCLQLCTHSRWSKEKHILFDRFICSSWGFFSSQTFFPCQSKGRVRDVVT